MSGDLNLMIRRFSFHDKFTKGEMLANGIHLGYTCEDVDRRLESGGTKVVKETAIPRGRYRMIISYSNRFEKEMPEVIDVPQFSGVRIHGGNTHSDTEGCPLFGTELTPDGVRGCMTINSMLIKMIGECIAQGHKCWLEIV